MSGYAWKETGGFGLKGFYGSVLDEEWRSTVGWKASIGNVYFLLMSKQNLIFVTH